MFGEEKKIISITSKTVEGAIVGGGVKPKVRTTGEVQWTPETIKDVLKSILVKLKTNNVLLLLGEDIAYVTTLSIPKATPESKERSTVYEQIRYLIPEELSDRDWDYIVTDSRRGSKSILVFAPVMETFHVISNALRSLGCEVQAVEPASVSKLRNRDPLVGISRKRDFKGADDKTLNINLAEVYKHTEEKKDEDVPETIAMETDTKSPQTTQKASPGAYLIALVLITFFSVAAIAGILYSRTKEVKQDLISNQITPSPDASPTIDVLPSPEINVADLAVAILNGSGTAGKAASVAAILEDAGFNDIETGNADRDDYEQTIIQLKESSSSAPLLTKLEELLADYEVATGEVLTATASSDLLIIVGIN